MTLAHSPLLSASAGATHEPPTQITRFNESEIFYFAISPDGSRIAVVRGTTVSDVVLLTNADAASH